MVAVVLAVAFVVVAFAVAVGLFGEVYAGGIGATNHAAFAVIGG